MLETAGLLDEIELTVSPSDSIMITITFDPSLFAYTGLSLRFKEAGNQTARGLFWFFVSSIIIIFMKVGRGHIHSIWGKSPAPWS